MKNSQILWIEFGDSSYTPLGGGLPEVWGYKHKVLVTYKDVYQHCCSTNYISKSGLSCTIGKPVVMLMVLVGHELTCIAHIFVDIEYIRVLQSLACKPPGQL